MTTPPPCFSVLRLNESINPGVAIFNIQYSIFNWPAFSAPWVLALLWLIPLLGCLWLVAYRHAERRMSAFISADMQGR